MHASPSLRWPPPPRLFQSFFKYAPSLTATSSFPTFSASDTAESHFDSAAMNIVGVMGAISGEKEQQLRLIVEALVVRKISVEEAFLGFSGLFLT